MGCVLWEGLYAPTENDRRVVIRRDVKFLPQLRIRVLLKNHLMVLRSATNVMKTLFPIPIPERAKISLTPFLAICGLVAFMGGCASEPESHVVSAPPPGAPVVTQAPPATVYATPAPGGSNTIVVTQAPPAPQQEVVTVRPSSEHVWVGGYWTWHNNRYEWIPGQWVVPPRSGVTWIPPRWGPEGNAYRFYEGRWE